MPRTRQHHATSAWRRLGILRILISVLMVMSLSGLAHGAEEAVGAIVAPDCGDDCDDCDDDCDDEFCFGTMHNCGCCPTAVAATASAKTLPASPTFHADYGTAHEDAAREAVPSRIDRPPRA